MKKKPPDYKPPRDYKYRSGNEGRHHPGLIHPGYYWPTRPKPYVRFVPKGDEAA